MKQSTMGLLAAAALAAFSLPVRAQQVRVCGPVEQMRAELRKHFDEETAGIARGTYPNVVYEFFVSPGGATFTVLARGLAGIQPGHSCIVLAGKNFVMQEIPPAKPPGKDT